MNFFLSLPKSKRLRSGENMKMGRNSGLLLGPRSLKGDAFGPVKPAHMVFSDDQFSFKVLLKT